MKRGSGANWAVISCCRRLIREGDCTRKIKKNNTPTAWETRTYQAFTPMKLCRFGEMAFPLAIEQQRVGVHLHVSKMVLKKKTVTSLTILTWPKKKTHFFSSSYLQTSFSVFIVISPRCIFYIPSSPFPVGEAGGINVCCTRHQHSNLTPNSRSFQTA